MAYSIWCSCWDKRVGLFYIDPWFMTDGIHDASVAEALPAFANGARPMEGGADADHSRMDKCLATWPSRKGAEEGAGARGT